MLMAVATTFGGTVGAVVSTAGCPPPDDSVLLPPASPPPVSGQMTDIVELPSKGDNSYPGFVWHGGKLWMSYYSSHEGKTSIYLAKIEVTK